MGHLYHGCVSHNQRVTWIETKDLNFGFGVEYWSSWTCKWNGSHFGGVFHALSLNKSPRQLCFCLLLVHWDVHLLLSKLTYRSGKRTICRSWSHRKPPCIGISLLHRGSSIWITVKMVEDHCSIAETLLSEMCTKHCKAIGPPPKKKRQPLIVTEM